MAGSDSRKSSLIYSALSSSPTWITFAIVMTYTAALFFGKPYVGFEFEGSTGEIAQINDRGANGDALQLGDILLEVNSVAFDEFLQDLYKPLLVDVEPGDSISLVILRDGTRIPIDWITPGPSPREVVGRLASQWFLPFLFFGFGLATFLFIRPKDARWRLLIAFNYLSAIWLSTTSLSSLHIGLSALVLRSGVWLSVPILLHLHWVFPKPFRRLPAFVNWLVYGIPVLLAVGEWVLIFPRAFFLNGLILALVGTIVLLIAHVILQPGQRREVWLVLLAALLAVMPIVSLSVLLLFATNVNTILAAGGLIALPLLPGAYFYSTYRRQLGGLEVRTNRIIAFYLYVILLFSSSIVLVPLVATLLNVRGDLTLGILTAALAGTVTALVYSPFQRFVEHRVLSIPLPQTKLLRDFSTQISTRLNEQSLIVLLKERVLPTLLIRQSALLRIKDSRPVNALFNVGVAEQDLPKNEDVPTLVAKNNWQSGSPWGGWVRLSLPLFVEGNLLGLWLFGRHDPDDTYSQSEIELLETLADQTAIALVNIDQAGQLRALYQANIDRDENERARLARELHDQVLGDLGVMKMTIEDPGIIAGIQKLITTLRETIRGLRPGMLSYGLGPALDELADELNDRRGAKTRVEAEIYPKDGRFDANVELHLFRIIQQACENALRHAQADHLQIQGQITPEGISLSVQDDGIGMDTARVNDLSTLITEGHFGLAGMYERALIVDAKINITSNNGKGTTFQVDWQNRAANGREA